MVIKNMNSKTKNTCCSSTQYTKQTIERKSFPTKELRNWLTNRKFWDHNDWLTLLSSLRSQGFNEWTETQRGRETIGQYLETNRAR